MLQVLSQVKPTTWIRISTSISLEIVSALRVESPRHELILLPSASSIIYSDRSATTTLATLLVFNTKLDEAVGGAIAWLIVIVGFFNSALYDHGSDHGSTAAYQ